MQPEVSRDVAADAEGGRPDRARTADPLRGAGVELRRSQAITHSGRGPEAVPVPFPPLPSRRLGLGRSRRTGQDVPEGEVVTFGVALLGPDNHPTKILIAWPSGWPTARAAEEYARDRANTAGYRVVPLQRVAGP